ncbi:ganglioside GM2 activator-like [Mercenaria mercenaria]|uniref:ganglioside GM2 activator-like n=1 Tax=Mercenaria mercenaria TaxID=6596 RepID=UPI00234E4CF4|nr:ganglioside GM2 activator-like [Mercenaria mercenaria]
MSVLKLMLVLVLLSLSQAYNHFALTDCSSNSNSLLTINGHLLEYPIEIPGHVRVSSTVDIHRPIRAGHLRLDATIQKWIVFDYFTLPCISWVGSCSYDVCDLLSWFDDRGCPWQLESNNFPCTCPFNNGTYTLDPHPFYIPEVRGPWQWIAYGDFRVIGSLIDEDTSEEVACYSLEFAVEIAPTSWGWW